MGRSKKPTAAELKKIRLVKMIQEVTSSGSSKDTWNPAEISEGLKNINFIRRLVDIWNPAQLNEAIRCLGFKTIDTWNPAIIDEMKFALIRIFALHSVTGNPITLNLTGELPYLIKEATATFSPKQDLHGYDYPWAGGNGKNRVEITKTGSITTNGITFTVNADGTVTANGTATATAIFFLKQSQDFGKDLQPNTEYIISSGYGNANVWLGFYYDNNTNWSASVPNDGERTFTTISDFNYVRFAIRIGNGETVNNAIFKPMVRLSTISDPTFEPYSNICPISGWDGLHLTRMGKNLIVGKITSASIDASGVVTSNSTYDLAIVPIIAGNNYAFSSDGTLANSYFAEYLDYPAMGMASYGARSQATNTTATINGYIAFRIAKTETKPQCEIGIIATDYEAPITPTTHTATFPETIMGGSYDFVSGKGDGTFSDKVDLGSLTWAYDSNGQRFYSSALSDMKNTEGWNKLIFYSENYKKGEPKSDGTGGDNIIGLGNNRIYIRNTQYTDAETFKTAMSGYYVCYELATLTPIELTGQEIEPLPGVNVFSTDADTLNIKYQIDLS